VADGTQSTPDGRDPAAGAAPSAPTAPHATPGVPGHRLTGPERFWTSRWRRVIGWTSLLASGVIHYVLTPWSILPEREFELRDTAGDLSIPVDLLAGEETPLEAPSPKEPAVAPPVDPAHPAPGAGDALDAGPAAMRPDAIAPRDAAPDAPRVRKHPDAGAPRRDAAPRDAPPRDAGSGRHEDAAIAQRGEASGVARDAVGMIGAAGSAQAGPQNVIVTINMAAIRTHPVGARMGPLFSALPQWDDFLIGTGVDPLRDTDWVSINGPSLIHSDRDVILVHYSANDLVVERALDAVARKSANGRAYDAGVAGMKAVLGHADRADRVFMRPQPHVLAVVPTYYASTAARMLTRARIPRAPKRPAEALRLTLLHPHGPMPAIPESVTELRLWIVPRNSDGGADVYAEGDTASAEASESAVDVLREVVREQNSFAVRLITRGLLDGLTLTADGATLRMHVPAARDQLEVILAFAAGRLGVDLVPPDAGRGDAQAR